MMVQDTTDEFDLESEGVAEEDADHRDHEIESLDELISENIGLITGMLAQLKLLIVVEVAVLITVLIILTAHALHFIP